MTAHFSVKNVSLSISPKNAQNLRFLPFLWDPNQILEPLGVVRILINA